MSGKPKKPKLEQDFADYDQAIEAKAEEEIKKIKQKIEELKKEAEKIGQSLETQDSDNREKS